MTERRHFPRTEITGPVTARTSRNADLRLVDMSTGGLRCLSSVPLRPGQVLRITLPAGAGRLQVEAAVRRCRAVSGREGFPGIAYEAGLEFLDLDRATVATMEGAYLGRTPPAQEAGGSGEFPEIHGFSMVRAG